MSAPPDNAPVAPRLSVVNGLRGVAIVAVVYHHVLSLDYTPIFEARFERVGPYQFTPSTLLSNGWLGVNLFFLLSGFVLALPYALGQRTFSSPRDVLAFYVRRGQRLLPLYYLTLFVALLIGPPNDFSSPRFLDEVLAMTTFTYTFREKMFLPRFNVALWSLGVEVWFSVLFPLLVLAWRRFGITSLTLAAFALSLWMRLDAAWHHRGAPVLQLIGKDSLLGRLDDFVLGMALAELHVRGKLPKRGVATLAVVVGVALVTLGSAAWDNVVFRTVPFGYSAYFNVPVALGFGLVLLGLLGDAPALRAVFTLPPLQLLGMMCYSLYLWHQLGVHQRVQRWWSVSDAPLYLAFTFALSAITYRYVEFPKRSLRELFGFSYSRGDSSSSSVGSSAWSGARRPARDDPQVGSRGPRSG